ncbi:DNRLRE domain-containing protein [Coraliomargarita sp. SDUM461004]|uniref:DNRLRE domain-containing protein n=1 Tax=Thalassobacterium sedimentorum TaxID=3041258 RepID=A0ABU1AIN6_9BACT|nr:DNRLRE domain-containing protein [Coraliomargarita sp. SDUM461004]MDQ8193641.1 DNRLRE domain-containing protein [Coraliomargarita sp. SDUM461004]
MKLSHSAYSLAALLAALASLPMVVSAETLDLVASADGFIRTGQIVDNVQDTTEANLLLVGNVSASDELRGFLQFDLSDPLLTGATINSVTLTLTIGGGDSSSVDGVDTLNLYQTNTAFTEGGAQWDTPWTTDGGDLDALVASATADAGTVITGDTVSFSGGTLDTAVFNTIGGSIGLILSVDSIDAARSIFRFTSRTPVGNPASYVPVLSIDYTATVPEPSTYALLAGLSVIGLAVMRRRK